MKIIPLAIIRSPSDKEKINFRGGLRIPINEPKRGILGQRAREVRVSAFAPTEVGEWRGCANISGEIKTVPGYESDQHAEKIDRPLDADINIENTINRQNNQSRNDRQDITNAQIDEKQRIEQKQH